MTEAKKTTKKVSKKAPNEPKLDSGLDTNKSFAIIETGGKQYRVSVGDTIKIEKVKSLVKDYKEGDSLIFDKVLLVDNGVDATDIGTPYIDGAKVSATISSIGRNPKITVIKYKQKSRYFKKNGHRQPHFKVTINTIA